MIGIKLGEAVGGVLLDIGLSDGCVTIGIGWWSALRQRGHRNGSGEQRRRNDECLHVVFPPEAAQTPPDRAPRAK
jgi:hypothetical protein